MAEAAALVGAAGAALVVLASGRAALLAGLGLVLAAMAGLAAEGGQADSLGTLFGSPAGLAAVAAGIAVLAGAAALLLRWPEAVVPLLLATAPIRPPVASDPDSPVLLGLVGTGALGRLYPLYVVLAASVVALAWRTARGAAVTPVPRALAVPAALFLALTTGSLLWSEDRAAATQDLLFFWLPFTVLFVVAAQTPFPARAPRVLAITLVGIACVFAVVGILQATTERLLFFNASLEQANELGSLFRVTSAFQDPNHLGRHLVLAAGVVLVAVWLRRVALPAALALLAVLGAGLWFTYSQSSLVTLAVVALAVGLVAADRPTRRVLTASTAVLMVGGVLALGALLATGASDEVTSDRSTLVTDTARVAVSHPLAGVGVSSQPLVTRREEAPEVSKLQNVSHTTPLTVAAELGAIGLAVLAALIVGAVQMLRQVAREGDRAVALGIGAVLLTLLVHSLFYGGLFENPITWGALGVGAAAAAAGRGTRTRGGGSRALRQRTALRSWRPAG